jgi:acyl dehydratase
MTEPEWTEWGPPVRVRIDESQVWAFARAVKDPSPLYRSRRAATDEGFDGLPVPPTYTFVMAGFGAWPDLQPSGGRGRLMEASPEDVTLRPGLSLHGEQEFVYHRWPVAGEVLEGRMRTSAPWRKVGRRTMDFRWLQTRWSDLDGRAVVEETITAVYIPTEEELSAEGPAPAPR